MAKVLGLGGLFFKSPDPEKLLAWYSQWLGIGDGKNSVEFRPQSMPANGFTVWSPFPSNTDYFVPSNHHFMFNLIVDNLDEALGQVHLGGGQVVGEIEEHEYGRFGWFIDPDGNKVELWQPPLPGRVGRRE
jgi:predicted enzyme related to lactoylglutathione lyase